MLNILLRRNHMTLARRKIWPNQYSAAKHGVAYFASTVTASSSKVRLYRGDSTSVFFNLAFEEWLLEEKPQEPILFLWRNSPSINIGRHQNPWKECRLSMMDKDGCALVRRYSGGGAIFQDMGCTTFTFLNPVEHASIDRNFEILEKGLKQIGISAKRKGRNDMEVDGKKMSGSAFKNVKSHSLHHGTILLDTDMAALGRYLTPNEKKLQSKGISSVEARVVNLKEIKPDLTHDDVVDAVRDAFLETYDAPLDTIELKPTECVNEAFHKHHDKLLDWEWRFGRTPEFSHAIEFRVDGIGLFDVHIQVTNAIIVKVKVFSDVLFPNVVTILETSLEGCVYDPAMVKERISNSLGKAPENEQKLLQELSSHLANEISATG